MSIFVITAGGTIGAMPYDNPKKPPEFITVPPDNRDIVRETLEQRHNSGIRYGNAGLRDSNLIDEAYRMNLVKLAEDAPESKILITHGTDKLLQTADFFYQKLKSASLSDKIAVITGSMMPLSNGPESDGYANLDFSLALLTENKINPGIHIVLCDYENPETRKGWKPHLYAYKPGQYEKFYDPEDGRYHRLQLIGNRS